MRCSSLGIVNQTGALGDGQLESQSAVPVAVAGGHTFTSIEASGGWACAIASTGELYCWGQGNLVPTLVAGDLRWTQVTIGGDHACGLTTSALIYCWGNNNRGQVGIGQMPPAFVDAPARIHGVDAIRWRQVAAGTGHTCAIDTDSATWCWGYGEDGALGNGTLVDKTSPVRVATRTVP